MGQLIYKILIGPLDLYFEYVFALARQLFGDVGLTVIPMSLAVSFICLPFYRRAEQIQAEERALEKSMERGIAHIRSTFTGDERFMMLQSYYRIKHYHPLYALKSSLPLALQIPFFISAFRFLSGLEVFRGAAFGPIADLSAPDGLLTVAGCRIHLLPILMTAINLLSGAVYSKGHTKREKLQLYGVAAVFLVLLYNSPAGLLLYWTCNNVFSLVRNLIDHAKERTFFKNAVFCGLSAFFLMAALFSSLINGEHHIWAYAVAVLFLLPLGNTLFGKKLSRRKGRMPERNGSEGFFLSGCLLLTLLVGLLIPLEVIKSSPAEFIVLSAWRNPLSYVLDSLASAAGLFIVWFGLFYFLSDNPMRKRFHLLVLALCGIALTDYLFFGTHLGTINALLQFENGLVFEKAEVIANIAVLIGLAAVLLMAWRKYEQTLRVVASVMVAVIIGMSVWNAVSISRELDKIRKTTRKTETLASYTLSREAKNVIILTLDKAISSFVPYMFQERPELEAQFDGFTWYPNTISYGWGTNTGSPAIYGGYEYTPEEMNRRSGQLLADKHNEALKLMPVLFDRAGYDVTVCDAPYAGYTWIPDMTIYDDYPNIHTYLTNYGQFRYVLEDFNAEDNTKEVLWRRNFFYYGMMKILPLPLQSSVYKEGRYLNANPVYTDLLDNQHQVGLSKAKGIDGVAVDNYAALKALPEITSASSRGAGSFLMLYSCAAHDTMLYQEPEYVPALSVDNTEYDRTHTDRFTLDGKQMTVADGRQMRHYHANMATMIQLGQWFDHLRALGVYDNTRIILVADHGLDLGCFEDLITEDGLDIMRYNPLLMVKDFNGKGFRRDDSFMTNADTPTLAFSGIINDPVNPFTGKAVRDEAKHSGEQHIMAMGGSNQVNENNGTTFQPGKWYALQGEYALNRDSWIYLGKY